VRQINRTAMMLALLPIKMADPGQGQAITWAIKTSGATAQAVADGGAAPTAGFDKRVKASLVYGDYQSTVTETGQAIAAAAHSATPDDLIDLISGDIEDAGDAMASQINKDFWVQGSTGGGILPVTSTVELTPAYTGGPVMSSGAVIPQQRTAVPVEFDDLRKQLEKLTKTLQPTEPGGVSTLGALVNTAAENLRAA